MTSVFFSYSHRDEDLRDKLEAHLAILKRDGTIDTWHDRRIGAGDDLAGSIDAAIRSADVILILVSSDFLNSDYCYDTELGIALDRHAAGEAKVIPVILRNCDWHNSRFGHLLAAPKDGLPVVKWPDLDDAFVDVVSQIRAALPKKTSAERPATPNASMGLATSVGPRSSNLRVTKSFTDADRDRFLSDAFDFMAKFFENSIDELSKRNPGIEGTFRRVDANSFTGVIYKDGKSLSRCKIRMGGMFGRGIDYSHSDTASDNSSNGSLTVDADSDGMFLKSLFGSGFGRDQDKQLTFEGAAEHYWDMFIQPLQYER